MGILISKELHYRIPTIDLLITIHVEFMIIEIKCKHESLIIVNMYRPLNTHLASGIQEIKSILSQVMKLDKQIVICTDHNIDLLKASSHNKTQEFLENCVEMNLLSCITKPTCITHSSTTLIDNIFIDIGLRDASMNWVIIDDSSDHFPCLTAIPQLCPDNLVDQYVHKRKFMDKVYTQLECSLNQINWQELLEHQSCDDAFNAFHDILVSRIDKYTPEKLVKISHKSVQPWISKRLLRCLSKQKRMYTKTRKLPKEHPKVLEYRKYRSLLQKIIRRAKMAYYSQKCADIRSETKKLWNVINKMTGKTVNKHDIIDSLSIDHTITKDCCKIANEFGEYLSTVGKSYAEKTPKQTKSCDDYTNSIERNAKSLFLHPTNPTEIRKIISNLKNKNSSGIDDISNVLIKRLIDSLVEPLSIIFNKSLEEGVFLDRMKIAEVVPLYKGKSRIYKENYRPISLLITVSKILEKIMHAHTYKFLE